MKGPGIPQCEVAASVKQRDWGRRMSRSSWYWFAFWAFLAIPAELMIGFGLWFSPGWANVEAGGPQIYIIWPAGLSAIGFFVLMTAAAAVSATLAATADPERRRLDRKSTRLNSSH